MDGTRLQPDDDDDGSAQRIESMRFLIIPDPESVSDCGAVHACVCVCLCMHVCVKECTVIG